MFGSLPKKLIRNTLIAQELLISPELKNLKESEKELIGSSIFEEVIPQVIITYIVIDGSYPVLQGGMTGKGEFPSTLHIILNSLTLVASVRLSPLLITITLIYSSLQSGSHFCKFSPIDCALMLELKLKGKFS